MSTQATTDGENARGTARVERQRDDRLRQRDERLRLRMPNHVDRARGGPAAADALARERRRIAAEVHDLVMQDLALALANARVLADDPVLAPRASMVVAAGERALAGARRILDDLAAQDREPVIEAVGRSVRAAARDVPLRFHARGISAGAQPDQPTVDALVHIGREAVTNAIKHASPKAIEVELVQADEWCLRVRDDGRGCHPGHGAHAGGRGGFGLASMKRHAQALGGSLRIATAPGAGTTVEAVLP
jgi:signal transduction histidine kinase